MKAFFRMGTALAVALTFAISAMAADDGAKTPKNEGPPAVAGENKVMRCPKCETDYQVKTTRPPKGSTEEKTVVANHVCEKCGTKLETVGGGKALAEMPVHTCTDCK